jgi:hypothetical protein
MDFKEYNAQKYRRNIFLIVILDKKKFAFLFINLEKNNNKYNLGKRNEKTHSVFNKPYIYLFFLRKLKH